MSGPIAWGAKVSPEFKARAIEVAEAIGVEPSDLMSCMAFESAETFSPSVRNAAGSGATGLIQFMPRTADALGTSTRALSKMTNVQQLDWVEKYFAPYAGRLKSIDDLYMAILWPKAVGKPDDYVLFDGKKWPTGYRQNRGLDKNKDLKVTKFEAAASVRAKRVKGLGKGYLG